MSILLEEKSGWFIDSKNYFDKIYDECYDKKFSKCELKFQSAFFQIKTPFVMKSHAIKVSKNLQDRQLGKVGFVAQFYFLDFIKLFFLQITWKSIY